MAQDILITPGSGEPQILFRGSGVNDTAVELNVLSSYQSANGSGTALLFEGTQGQLFGITDNLSSGTIFSVSDITGLPSLEVNASGDVKIGEYGRDILSYRPVTNTQTWNDAANTFTAMKLDVTDTASASDSKLLDLQVGGTSKFQFRKDNRLFFPAYSHYINGVGNELHITSSNQLHTVKFRNFNLILELYSQNSTARYSLMFSRRTETPTILTVDEPSVFAQRNGTNAQEFRLYNTYTDASNYERGFLKWDANVFKIGTEAAGTGVTRSFELASPTTITGGTVTASTPVLNATQTWNDAAVTFTGMKLDVTDTASAADSKLLDLQVGGTSKFSVNKEGYVKFSNGSAAAPSIHFAGDDDTGWSYEGPGSIQFSSVGIKRFQFDNAGIRFASNGGPQVSASISTATLPGFTFRGNPITGMGWPGTNQLSLITAGTTALSIDASQDSRFYGDLELRDGANATAFTLYNTYTDASNYERGFLKWDANTFKIGTEAAGTGTVRDLHLGRFFAKNYSTSNAIFGLNTGQSISTYYNTWGSGTLDFFAEALASVPNDTSMLFSIRYPPGDDGVCIKKTLPLCWGDLSSSPYRNLTLYGDVQYTLSQRRGTNPQAYHIYNTYTDASNYERGFLKWDSNVFNIAVEAAGTGTAREIVIGDSSSSRIRIRHNDDVHFYRYSAERLRFNSSGSSVFGNFIFQDSFVQMTDIATPSTPAANTCRIYAKDNGSGKTQLVVLMPDGIETVLATET